MQPLAGADMAVAVRFLFSDAVRPYRALVDAYLLRSATAATEGRVQLPTPAYPILWPQEPSCRKVSHNLERGRCVQPTSRVIAVTGALTALNVFGRYYFLPRESARTTRVMGFSDPKLRESQGE